MKLDNHIRLWNSFRDKLDTQGRYTPNNLIEIAHELQPDYIRNYGLGESIATGKRAGKNYEKRIPQYSSIPFTLTMAWEKGGLHPWESRLLWEYELNEEYGIEGYKFKEYVRLETILTVTYAMKSE